MKKGDVTTNNEQVQRIIFLIATTKVKSSEVTQTQKDKHGMYSLISRY